MSEQPLNGDQVEQVIRLSLPHFQQGVRTELDRLRTDFSQALNAQTRVIDGKLESQTRQLKGEIKAVDDKVQAMDDRLKALEGVKARVVMMWGGIVTVASAVATVSYHVLRDWLFGGAKK